MRPFIKVGDNLASVAPLDYLLIVDLTPTQKERERESDLILYEKPFFDLPALPVRTAQTIPFIKALIFEALDIVVDHKIYRDLT